MILLFQSPGKKWWGKLTSKFSTIRALTAFKGKLKVSDTSLVLLFRIKVLDKDMNEGYELLDEKINIVNDKSLHVIVHRQNVNLCVKVPNYYASECEILCR